jgi:Uncharacterized conserved protein (DUF2190)
MADGNLPTYVTEATTFLWAGGITGPNRLAGSFVNCAGGFAVTGAGFLGVTNAELALGTGAAGTPVGVDMEGIVQVNSAGAITLGAPLTCQAVTGEFSVAAAGQDIHGRALGTTSAAGQRVLMKITREGKA